MLPVNSGPPKFSFGLILYELAAALEAIDFNLELIGFDHDELQLLPSIQRPAAG